MGQDIVQVQVGSVGLVMSAGGVSKRDFRFHATVAVLSAVFYAMLVAGPLWLIAAVVCAPFWPPGNGPNASLVAPTPALFVGALNIALGTVLAWSRWPHVLRVTFTPAERPTQVRVVRWWRTSRLPISALSAVTVIEHRERPRGGTPATDATRAPTVGVLRRVDAVLHRADGRARLVRGGIGKIWYPDSEHIYDRLADLLAPMDIAIHREICWRRPSPPPSTRWFSPGSGGANAGGV
jgi:hypothetical protein